MRTDNVNRPGNSESAARTTALHVGVASRWGSVWEGCIMSDYHNDPPEVSPPTLPFSCENVEGLPPDGGANPATREAINHE